MPEDWGEVADRLLEMTGEARSADAEALGKLETEYDEQFAEVIRTRAAGGMENEDASLITATFEHVRRALDARRKGLEDEDDGEEAKEAGPEKVSAIPLARRADRSSA